jgi:hypothetical protein
MVRIPHSVEVGPHPAPVEAGMPTLPEVLEVPEAPDKDTLPSADHIENCFLQTTPRSHEIVPPEGWFLVGTRPRTGYSRRSLLGRKPAALATGVVHRFMVILLAEIQAAAAELQAEQTAAATPSSRVKSFTASHREGGHSDF